MKGLRSILDNSLWMSAVLLTSLIWLCGCPPPYAYITNEDSDTVSVIDTRTDVVMAVIAVGESPSGVAVLPDGSAAYVTNWVSGTVSVIDRGTLAVVDTIDLGYPDGVLAGVGITVTPDGSRVYVGDNRENVTVIDTASNTVVDTIPGFVSSFNVAAHPDGSRIYVTQVGIAAPGVEYTRVIDTTTNTLTPALLPGTALSWAAAVHPDGSRLYVAEGASVNVIDTSTNGLISAIPLQGWGELNMRSIAVSPDGAWAYATYQFPDPGVCNPAVMFDCGRVAVINTTTNTIADTIDVGNFPTGVDVLPDGSKVYVVGNGSSGGSVSVIDAATLTVTGTISTGIGNGPTSFGSFIG